MSSCRFFKSRLGRYHDGELSSVARLGVEQHLRDCRACSNELAEIRRVSGVLQEALKAPHVPETLAGKIMARAHIQTGGTPVAWDRLWFWRCWSLSMRFAAAGVAAAAIYIGLAVGSASPPSSRPPGDEMRWIGMTSRGPIVAAYVGAKR